MKERVWIERPVILAMHDEQLAAHGGATGIRDEGLLDFALGHPPRLAADGEAEVAELGAAYGFAVAHGRPFVDGNERTALIATELFLGLHGYRLTASDADCVLTMLAVAAGDIDEAAFAAWIRANAKPR